MKIVIIGGSGLIGSKLVNKLRRLEHEVVSASPDSGINTFTGEGLNEALKDTDVVVDVSNSPSFEDKAVMSFFKESTLNTLEAGSFNDVKHHVALSIVGVDRLTASGYMRAKALQEDLIKASGVPYTILRSTQFFELAGRMARAGAMGEEIRISSAAIQPIASDDVVSALTDIVLGAPLNTTVEIAGPVAMPMYELVRYYLNETEDSHRLVEDKHALYFGAELNDESLVPAQEFRMGTIKYEEWFHQQLA